ncbi:MAG: hypothetical protein V4603_02545, partial [Pseudomonadota bacterium]
NTQRIVERLAGESLQGRILFAAFPAFIFRDERGAQAPQPRKMNVGGENSEGRDSPASLAQKPEEIRL